MILKSRSEPTHQNSTDIDTVLAILDSLMMYETFDTAKIKAHACLFALFETDLISDFYVRGTNNELKIGVKMTHTSDIVEIEVG